MAKRDLRETWGSPTNAQFWGGVICYLVLIKLQQMENSIMALADTLAELQAEDTELAADVTALVAAIGSESAQIADLQAQIAALSAGSVTQEQLDALQTVADDLAATHATAAGAVPPPAP
jgi:chromosome segregation ATPase